jgi:hypothetical protein
MYHKIVNPESGRRVNINGKQGKRVLDRYLHQLGGADGNNERDVSNLYTFNTERFFSPTFDQEELWVDIHYHNDEVGRILFTLDHPEGNPDGLAALSGNLYAIADGDPYLQEGTNQEILQRTQHEADLISQHAKQLAWSEWQELHDNLN